MALRVALARAAQGFAAAGRGGAAVAPCRSSSAAAASGTAGKLKAAPMVYIKGEEMTRYVMQQVLEKWIEPFVDTSAWEYHDLSCKARDDSEDQVLKDAVAAGARVKAIFKEPTITPTEVQKEAMGLKKAWGSPNGAMRRGWNGITISRDTIHIEGMKLGFERPVLFERHAVGGEYGAGFKVVGKGTLASTFVPSDGSPAIVVDSRVLTDDDNVAVCYHNPYDNVTDLAHHFFKRCLEAEVVPYVVTKKTVFKWQEPFWTKMKDVFDADYKDAFAAKGLLKDTSGELAHLISDAATMQIIRWTKGGFGMAAHNYDGDMLTDEVAQVHRSPGFITSNLIGKAADGSMIKEFEASHGTAADMDADRLAGKETSFNPLGMVEALIGAMNHAEALNPCGTKGGETILEFTTVLRRIMHRMMVTDRGTRDLCGPSGLTTEQFIDVVAERLGRREQWVKTMAKIEAATPKEKALESDVDKDALAAMFRELDADGDGEIQFEEFVQGLLRLGVKPPKRDIIKK